VEDPPDAFWSAPLGGADLDDPRSVRTRDGSERLDHAYRRLLSLVPSPSPLGPDDPSPVPGRASEPRR
jgi:hypothetical protein